MELFGAIDEAAELGVSELTKGMFVGLLKSAAGTTMFCPITSRILDYRTCVVVTVEGDTNEIITVSPEGWEQNGAGAVEVANRNGSVVKVMTWALIKAACDD